MPSPLELRQEVSPQVRMDVPNLSYGVWVLHYASRTAWENVSLRVLDGESIAISIDEISEVHTFHGMRIEYAVICDTMNLAAKIEKHNKTVRSRMFSKVEAYRLALARITSSAPASGS